MNKLMKLGKRTRGRNEEEKLKWYKQMYKYNDIKIRR
jgi:hypothetical protein